MTVAIRERHSTPLVTIDLWVRAGSREERPDEVGSAHFLEHLLFKGTSSRKVGEIDFAIESLGGTLNAATGPDYAHFYTTVVKHKVPQALAILSDLVRNATLPDNELEHERGVILDELAEHSSTPSSLLIDLLYSTAYSNSDHPYQNVPGGTPESIGLRGRDTLAAFYHRLYNPNRCTLVLVGDLNTNEGTNWAKAAFSDWAGVATASPLVGRIPSLTQGRTAVLRTEGVSPNESLNVGFAYPAPAARDSVATTAALLAAEILGNNHRYGRLVHSFSGEFDATVHFTPRKDSALWIVSVSYYPDSAHSDTAHSDVGGAVSGNNKMHSVASMERKLRDEISALIDSPPTPREFAMAQSHLLAKMDSELSTNTRYASAIGYAALTDAEPLDIQRLRIAQATLQELRAFISNYLAHPAAICTLIPHHKTGGAAK